MFREVGNAVGYLAEGSLRVAVAVILGIFGFSSLEFAVHIGLARIGVEPLLDAAIDAMLVGVCLGLALWILFRGIRERRRKVRVELSKIAELNHEIRNALQVISHSHFDAEPGHRELVLQSVDRVDKVLSRIFPGRAA